MRGPPQLVHVDTRLGAPRPGRRRRAAGRLVRGRGAAANDSGGGAAGVPVVEGASSPVASSATGQGQPRAR